MTALVRAEWTKLFTTRVWIRLLLGACALVSLFVVLITSFAGEPAQGGPPVPPGATGSSNRSWLRSRPRPPCCS